MLLELDDIHTYYGASYILQGVSLNVEEGEIVCLLGRNGVGKTTTLRTIMGLVHPASGHIKFKGMDVTRYPTHKISKLGISYMPQERPLFPQLTVKENLALGLTNLGRISRRSKDKRLEEVFDYFPLLKERKNQIAFSLSGGEQKILALARLLAGKAELLLLDEPLTGLAPRLATKFIQILTSLNKEKDVSILLVEQNATLSLKISTRCFAMKKGQISFEASSEEAKKSKELKTLLGVYA